jgi:hypothetical protein
MPTRPVPVYEHNSDDEGSSHHSHHTVEHPEESGTDTADSEGAIWSQMRPPPKAPPPHMINMPPPNKAGPDVRPARMMSTQEWQQAMEAGMLLYLLVRIH